MPAPLSDSEQPTSEVEGAEGGFDGHESGQPTTEVDGADGSQEDESDESSVHDRNGFLDLEAEEDEDGYDDDSEPDETLESFPQFIRLPIELRSRVWNFFDVAMRSPARVFTFQLTRLHNPETWASVILEQQTGPARATLATHRESRAMALKHYPDELSFNGGRALLRCNKAKDIFLLSSSYSPNDSPYILNPSWGLQIDVLDTIQNVALEWIPQPVETCRQLVQQRPHLRTIFQVYENNELSLRQMIWSAQPDAAQNFYVQVDEGEYGGGEETEFMYCWPKCASDANAPTLSQSDGELLSDDGPFVVELGELCKVFPLIRHSFRDGVEVYDQIRDAVLAGLSDSEIEATVSQSLNIDSVSDESEEDEYESSGIDDATIEQSDEEENDEDDLAVVQSSPAGEESTFGGCSPLEGEHEEEDEGADPSMEVAADFSSLESESPGAHDGGGLPPSARRSRVVVDSDDNEDISSDPPPRVPPAARRGRVVLESDDEDDDEEEEEDASSDPPPQVPPAARRGRAVVDSDDDSSDNDADDGKETKRTSLRRARVLASSESDDDDDDDDEGDEEDSEEEEEGEEEEESSDEEEDEPPKKLSLAERLQLFCSENPVEHGSDESAGSGGDEDGDGLDGDEQYYGAFQDDDDGDGNAAEYDGDDNLVMDMAEEDDEDGYDEYGGGEEEEW
jgi:hypothetical protein